MKKGRFSAVLISCFLALCSTSWVFASPAGDAVLSGIKSGASSIDISSFNLSPSEAMSVFENIYHTEPAAFRVNPTVKMSVQGAKVTAINVTYVLPESAEAQLDSAVGKIVEQASKKTTSVEKVKYVHDYIITHCAEGKTGFTAYDSLVKESAVCSGMTLGFKAVMDKMGIPCKIATSEEINHEWNMVQLDGKWYHIDVYWDLNESSKDRISKGYFLKNDIMFKITGHGNWVVDGDIKATDATYNEGL